MLFLFNIQVLIGCIGTGGSGVVLMSVKTPDNSDDDSQVRLRFSSVGKRIRDTLQLS